MNVQTPTMEFIVRDAKSSMKSTRKESLSKDKESFDNVLKGSQNNEKHAEITDSKPPVSKANKLKNKPVIESRNKVDNDSKKSADNNKDIPSEDEIISAIEEKVNIPKEKIKEILDQMGITAYDLLLPQQMQQFMQKLANVESSVDLLMLPNVNKIYKDIISVLNEFKSEFPNLQQMVSEKIMADNNLLKNQEFIQVELPEDHNSVSKDTETTITTYEGSSDDKPAKADENFSQQQSQDKAKDNEMPVIEIEKNKNSSNNTISHEEQSNHLTEIENDLDFSKNNDVNSKAVVFQQNPLSETQPISNSTLNQLSSSPMDPEQLIKQMVEHIKVNVSEDSAEMNLQLKPDHLGNLSLKIVTERGIVTAHFMAENQMVKEIIESNFNHLKDVLQEQGLKIENLEVSVRQDSNNQNSSFTNNKSAKSNKRISSIIANLSEDSTEVYENENSNPYRRGDSEVDFSA